MFAMLTSHTIYCLLFSNLACEWLLNYVPNQSSATYNSCSLSFILDSKRIVVKMFSLFSIYFSFHGGFWGYLTPRRSRRRMGQTKSVRKDASGESNSYDFSNKGVHSVPVHLYIFSHTGCILFHKSRIIMRTYFII